MEIQKRLYIGNLPSGVDENLIRNRFSKYGRVLGVELKQRKANDGSQEDEILSTFAFIDISAKKDKLDSCLKKLSRKKWDGQIIKIDFAKESVLSRLERERKELSLENKSNTTSKEAIKSGSDSPALLNGNSKWFGNSVRNCNGEVEDESKQQYPNNKRKSVNDIQQNNGKIRRLSESTIENGENVETKQPSSSPQASTPEQRRLKSLEEKMKLVSDRKRAVKAALSSVDSGNRKNKIIFKDDDDDNEGDGVCSFKEPENRIHASKQVNTPAISNPDTSNKERNNLFDDDSDDSDEETQNSRFEIKEHFDGKKGQKLLKLQSKYGNDSRFALDQRFAESSSSDDDDHREEEDENKATREKTRPDIADENSDKMHVDNRDDDEVTRQLEILQNLVGHQIIKPRADDSKPKKQKPGASGKGNQLCVRFDPTIAEHERFIVKPPPPGSEEETKVSKKRKKAKNTEENDPELDKSDTETIKAASTVEVSKETYYEVASDLKERLKSSGTGFSFSQLFSSDDKSRTDVEDDRLQPSDKSKEKSSIANKQSVGFEKNDDTKSDRMVSQNQTSGLSNLWKESFFFKDNDDRFQEGADFFMKNNDDSNRNFSDRRQELKLIVKSKMKRVMRKDRMFKKKIGGGFPSKTNKFAKKRVGIFPQLLRLLATHFPHLALVNDWMKEDIILSTKQTETSDLSEIEIEDGLSVMSSCPLQTERLLKKMLCLPATQLWPFAPLFIKHFNKTLESSVPRHIQELYRLTWLKLNTVLPRCLWVMTINALRHNQSALPDLTQENVVLDPLQVVRCDNRVFRCPTALAVLLRVLAACLQASRSQLSRHLLDQPLVQTAAAAAGKGQLSSDAEREELKSALIATQESVAAQILLEACMETESDRKTPGQMWALREVRSIICSHLHQVYIADPSLAKLIHFQNYPRELLSVAVPGIPSMHICLDFIPELLSQPNLEKQIFAVDLAAHLSLQYALPKSMSVARLCVSTLTTLLSVLSSTSRAELFSSTLQSLVCICVAFPPLVDDVIALLMQLARITIAEASRCNTISFSFLEPGSEQHLLSQIQEAFEQILLNAVLKVKIY